RSSPAPPARIPPAAAGGGTRPARARADRSRQTARKDRLAASAHFTGSAAAEDDALLAEEARDSREAHRGDGEGDRRGHGVVERGDDIAADHAGEHHLLPENRYGELPERVLQPREDRDHGHERHGRRDV